MKRSLLAAAFALVGVYLFPLVHRAFRALRHPMLYIVAGGVVLGLLGMLGGPVTLFKGLEQSAELLSHPSDYSPAELTVILLVKLAALVGWAPDVVVDITDVVERKVRALDVKVGDRVLFGKYSGQTVKVDGEELLVMREEDIMGVIESK